MGLAPSLNEENDKEQIEKLKTNEKKCHDYYGTEEDVHILREEHQIIRKDSFESSSKEHRSRTENVLTAIKRNGLNLKHVASIELLKSKKIVIPAILNKPEAIEFADFDLQENKTILLVLEQKMQNLKENYHEPYLRDREGVLKIVGDYGEILEYCIKDLQNDKEVVLKATEQSCFCLLYASKQLMSDKEFVLELMKINPYSFNYISSNLKEDKQFILHLLSKGYKIYSIIHSDHLRSDKEITIQAVKYDKFALECAPRSLRMDKDVVMTSVTYFPKTIAYASDDLKGDYDIVMKCLENDWETIKYLSYPKFDVTSPKFKKILFEILKKDPTPLDYLNPNIWCIDSELVSFALYYDTKLFRVLKKEFKEDKDICLLALREDGNILSLLSDKFKNDREIVIRAIKTNPNSFQYASEELKTDKFCWLAFFNGMIDIQQDLIIKLQNIHFKFQ